jgi:hypothetical protein
MKRTTVARIGWLLFLGAVPVFFLAQTGGSDFDEDKYIAEVQRLIAERGYTWTAGRTSVSGLSPEEKQKLLGAVPPPEHLFANIPVFQAPEDTLEWEYFDWRDYDGITPVTNQERCGSCWAFAAVAELESQMLIYDQRFADLSEQQVLSCITSGGSCSGGWAWEAYDLFMGYGSVSEGCMPYEADDTVPCRQDLCTPIGRIIGYESIANSVHDIKQALLRGPVWTTFTVVNEFYSYQDGCFDFDTNRPINHAVIIVGWDENVCIGDGAWICKNSWGLDFGNLGYFKIKYGACNIGKYSSQIIYEPSRTFVHLDTPDSGENFYFDQQVQITWTIGRETADSVKVFLGFDDGMFDAELLFAGTAEDDSYLWTVPPVAREGIRISVFAYIDGEVTGMDFTDNVYGVMNDIAVPWVELRSPDGGESYMGGDNVDITWVALDNACVDSLSIYFSANGGQDYELITSGEPNDSLYEWTVPQVTSESCRVMVVAYDPGMNTNYDQSDGLFSIEAVATGTGELTPSYANRLEQNFPNPFNGTTTIAYSVAGKVLVDIRLYDAAGRLIDVIERREREPGNYQTVWRGTDLSGDPVASGIYFCRIKAGGFSKSIKINYMR